MPDGALLTDNDLKAALREGATDEEIESQLRHLTFWSSSMALDRQGNGFERASQSSSTADAAQKGGSGSSRGGQSTRRQAPLRARNSSAGSSSTENQSIAYSDERARPRAGSRTGKPSMAGQ